MSIEIIRSHKVPLLFAVVGIFLFVLTIFSSRATSYEKRNNDIQFIEGSDKDIKQSVVVDIQGEVNAPGVYELEGQTRIAELIEFAGGFTDAADPVWVSKQLNQAQVIKDGMKLYIPSVSDTEVLDSNDEKGSININSSSKVKLESLPGIGEKRAQDIIDNRPYSSIDELVENEVISQSLFESIQNELSVY